MKPTMPEMINAAVALSKSLPNWLAPSGLLSIYSHRGESDNGALFSAEAYFALKAVDDYFKTMGPNEPESRLVRPMMDALRSAVANLERMDAPGVFRRSPGNRSHDSMDNAIAIMAMRQGFAERMLSHGENVKCTGITAYEDVDRSRRFKPLAALIGGFRTRFFWNCDVPTEFSFMGWHGRSPGHMAFLRTAAGRKPGPFATFVMLAHVFLAHLAPAGNTDARKLPFMALQIVKDRSPLWRLAYRLWYRLLLRTYKGGMAEVFDIYYREPGHPLKGLPDLFRP